MGYKVPRKVNVWNPTVANLTLMALGSSAPEIMLSVIETLLNLGKTPGELGPSTIVGSAAFNLLVISGVSIYAVTAEGDERSEEELEEDKNIRGVKKIKDLGVFTVTTIFATFAYIWLFIVLSDGKVMMWEAILTLAFFFILVIVAYIADKLNNKFSNSSSDIGDVKALPMQTSYSPIEFYDTLLPIESG